MTESHTGQYGTEIAKFAAREIRVVLVNEKQTARFVHTENSDGRISTLEYNSEKRENLS
jgi:hypothetical protein